MNLFGTSVAVLVEDSVELDPFERYVTNRMESLGAFVMYLESADCQYARVNELLAVVVGGGHFGNHVDRVTRLRFLRQAYFQGVTIAACAEAVGDLCDARIVWNHFLTGMESAYPIATQQGGCWVDLPVVADRELITARHLRHSELFVDTLIEQLTGEPTAIDRTSIGTDQPVADSSPGLVSRPPVLPAATVTH